MVNFTLHNVQNEQQLAFQMLICMRDVISIAKKSSQMPTYERSLELFHDFNPELYARMSVTLPQRNLNEEARLYVSVAEVESKKQQKHIEPIDLLESDITEFKEKLNEIDEEDNENFKNIYNKVNSLRALRKKLKPRKLSENRILVKDTAYANRIDYGAQFVSSSDFYVDYKLNSSKFLRIRMLHPDHPEHITGADLIYEQHNERTNMIRIMMLQYKTWEKGTLYFSQVENLGEQVRRMRKQLCEKGFCMTHKTEGGQIAYRFPGCAGFLRPTDKLQFEGSKLVSTGVHIPICQVHTCLETGQTKISRDDLGVSILDQDLFEPLFNRGFIGSGWIPEVNVRKFYEDNKIIEKDDAITFFAREIITDSRDPLVEVDR